MMVASSDSPESAGMDQQVALRLQVRTAYDNTTPLVNMAALHEQINPLAQELRCRLQLLELHLGLRLLQVTQSQPCTSHIKEEESLAQGLLDLPA